MLSLRVYEADKFLESAEQCEEACEEACEGSLMLHGDQSREPERFVRLLASS